MQQREFRRKIQQSIRFIYFASNFQNELFPQNTRSKFECYIQPTDLNYITSQDVEIAIKSITFDYDIESKSLQILGLKSNLSFDTIYSFGYNNIVAILTINPSDKGFYNLNLTIQLFSSSTIKS